MRLFYSPTSPYARKVRVCLFEKGIADLVELVTVNPLCDDTGELCRTNPLGKVPALVLDDGRAIIDSPVICKWLDTFAPEPQLIPIDPNDAIDSLTREAIADGVTDAAFSLVMEARRPEAQRSPEWIERWSAAIERGVKALDKRVMPDRFDLGDIASATALLYFDFRLASLGWRDANPALASWVDRTAARPSLAQTRPPA